MADSDRAETRRVSAAIFGNEKFAEVVLALDAAKVAHAQAVASAIGVPHNLTRSVLMKLASAGAITEVPRQGTRAPRYYTVPDDDQLWSTLVRLAKVVDARSRPAPLAGSADGR